jgi:feruloyl esterase
VDSRGKSIFPGFVPGDETSWRQWVVGMGPGGASGDGYVRNYFSYMVSGDPKWNVLTANVDASLKQAAATTGAEVDATSPDLSKFAAHGGKLIVYHGWNDQAISPWNSIHYYESVQKAMGADKAESMVRLYMAPGVEHCASGPGPSFFGQLGLPTTGAAKYGIFDSLVDWVEKSTPPSSIVATKYSDNKVAMTRPLCAYPQVAKYKGSGDTNDAASFTCSSE